MKNMKAVKIWADMKTNYDAWKKNYSAMALSTLIEDAKKLCELVDYNPFDGIEHDTPEDNAVVYSNAAIFPQNDEHVVVTAVDESKAEKPRTSRHHALEAAIAAQKKEN